MIEPGSGDATRRPHAGWAEDTVLSMFDLLQSVHEPGELLHGILDKLLRIIPCDLAMLTLDGFDEISVIARHKVTVAFLEDSKHRMVDLLSLTRPLKLDPKDLFLDLSRVPRENLVSGPSIQEPYEWMDFSVLSVAGETVGALAIASEKLECREERLEALRAVKQQIALLLDVARLHRLRQYEESSHAERLNTIMEVGEVFSADIKTDRILALLLELTLAMAHAEVGAISLLEGPAGKKVLDTKIAWGLEKSVHDQMVLLDGKPLSEYVLETGKPLIAPNLQQDPILDMKKLQVFLHSLAAFPLIFKGEKVGILKLVNAPAERLTNEADIHAIEIVSSLTAAAIVNARLYQESLTRQRIENELSLAFEIQKSLLPQEMPNIDGISAAGFSIPAHTIGGDYFDFLDIDASHLGIFIADVSGKGIPAAMVTMITRSYLHVSYRSELDPSKIMTYLNGLVAEDVSGGRFVTAAYAVLDTRTHELVLCSAGHPPALVYRALIDSIETTDTDNPPLGIFPDSIFDSVRIQLLPGDIFCLYTDGVIEAQNSLSEWFGIQRLIDVLISCRSTSAHDISRCIRSEVQGFAGQTPQHDDLTLTVLKIA